MQSAAGGELVGSSPAHFSAKTKKGRCPFLFLAEAVGFEPTDDFTRHSISSRDRYDHFDTLPYILICLSTLLLYHKEIKIAIGF